MLAYKLTNTQRGELVGQLFAPNQFFNPVSNIDEVYFIFEGEVENCVNEEFMWVKQLAKQEFIPLKNKIY